MLAACASPRERAYRAAMADYKRSEVAVVQFTNAHVKQLVSAVQTFHSSTGHWPRTFHEFGSFAEEHTPTLDLSAFNDLSFAALADDTVQVHYDINCKQFNNGQYTFTRTGSVHVTAK
jgi:hypothetical protein